MPYIVYDSKHPQGPTTPPQGAMKEYYYSYTGKNLDILDFQIDYEFGDSVSEYKPFR